MPLQKKYGSLNMPIKSLLLAFLARVQAEAQETSSVGVCSERSNCRAFFLGGVMITVPVKYGSGRWYSCDSLFQQAALGKTRKLARMYSNQAFL